MTKRINDDNCLVNHISTCPPPYYPPHANKVEYYVKFKSKYLEEDGVTVNWLWKNFVPFACESASRLNSAITTGVSYAWNNRTFSGVDYKINNYVFSRGYSSSVYKHALRVFYFKECKKVIVDLIIPGELDHALKPSF